jgi:hypothetical protein
MSTTRTGQRGITPGRLHALTERAMIRERRRQNKTAGLTPNAQARLLASTARRPRSIATHLLATGATPAVAGAVAGALHSVARRIDVRPVRKARTRRHTAPGGPRTVHTVYRYSRDQVLTLATTYRPRKAEYRAAITALVDAL